MKHITEEYGTECNKIESTYEEYMILKKFLEVHGVEARRCSGCGNKVEWQIRNDYKNWVHLNKNEKVCEQIINTVEDNIRRKSYQR